MRIYLLPGLGADKRMYARQMALFPGAVVLEHLEPVKGQSLAQYARRLLPLIDTSTPFVLIGTSLGGMLAMELSQIINPQKIVLIASVKSRDEMPLFIRSMKFLKLHKLIRAGAYKKMNGLMIKRLDGRGDAEAASIIRAMMDTTNEAFIEWAIDAVINWQPPKKLPCNIVHLHGTADQLFPIANIKNAIAVKNGSHVMNITKSAEVNRLLLQALNE